MVDSRALSVDEQNADGGCRGTGGNESARCGCVLRSGLRGARHSEVCGYKEEIAPTGGLFFLRGLPDEIRSAQSGRPAYALRNGPRWVGETGVHCLLRTTKNPKRGFLVGSGLNGALAES